MVQANVVSINPVEIFRHSKAHKRMPQAHEGLLWPAETSWTALLYPGAMQGLRSSAHARTISAEQLAQHSVLLTLAVPRLESMPFARGSDVRARCRYVSYLIKEMELYRHTLAGRIAGVHWVSDLVQLLCALELTKLMYSVNRKLAAGTPTGLLRSIELAGPPPEAGVLPLIHGLGFTDLCFSYVDGEHWTHEQMHECVALANSLGFERLHFRLETADMLDQVLRLTLPSSVHMAACHQEAASLLRGYQQVSPGYFVLQPRANHVDALWGLGLGAVSATPEGMRMNATRLDQYYEALDQGVFPLAV